MSKRIFYVGDVHVWHTTPRSRVDNYRQACLDILRRVGEFAEYYKAEAVLFGGDLGHDTDWPISLFHDVDEVLRAYPCPRYTAVGNHDMDGYNLDTWKKKGLGALVKSGAIQVQNLVEIGEGFRVEFFHAGEQRSKDLIEGTYKPGRAKDGRLEIAVAHVPVGPMGGGHMIGVDTLNIPFFDVVCVADIHMQFCRRLESGCWVINPGPLERRSIAEKDEGGCIYEINDKFDISLAKLGVGRGDEVFVAPAEKKVEKVLGKDFLEVMAQIRDEPQVPLVEQLRTMGNLLGTEAEAMDLLLGELKNA